MSKSNCIPSNARSILHALTCALLLTMLIGVAGQPVAAHSMPENSQSPASAFCIRMNLLGITHPQCETEAVGIPPEVQDQLDALSLSVLPFYNYDVAVAAGWDTILGECVESPAGGMGYHVHNMDQLLNGQLNLLRPEVLLYAPTEDGSMELHGVEYIIPAELWESPEPPEFLGQVLGFNPHVGESGIWALHVWVGTPNSEGIFEDWNPEVSCQFAHDAD